MFTSIYMMAFLAGLVSFLSPCIIPMITVYFSLITGMSVEELKEKGKSKAIQLKIIINTLLFIAAFTIVFSVAGTASGKVVSLIKENVIILNIIGGIMVIFLALKLLGLFNAISLKINALEGITDRFKGNATSSYFATFLVGIFFAIACSHCIGPLLYSMIIFAGNTGSSYTGMTVMFMFSMGLAVPYLLLGALFGKSINIINKIMKYQKTISFVTGAVLLVFGVLLLLNKFTLIVEILYKIIPFRSSLGM
ncbi:MAG TPA: cytochrome c biogenesis protein CcdA [Patescibacteria group bacterium]|nr:cytochrome c biogenesis protein CcdA [Patescibacteria group bacterium]